MHVSMIGVVFRCCTRMSPEQGPRQTSLKRDELSQNPKRCFQSLLLNSHHLPPAGDMTGGGRQESCLDSWQTAETRPGNNVSWIFQFGELKEAWKGWPEPQKDVYQTTCSEVPSENSQTKLQLLRTFLDGGAAFCQRCLYGQSAQTKPIPACNKFTTSFTQSYCLIWFDRLHLNF